MALFCLRKVSNKNSSFSAWCVLLVALFLPFFFSFLDVCVLSVACGYYCFFGLFGPRRKSATHRPKDVSNILSKVSPHNLASHHHRYQTHEKSFHAFQRERESLGALNNNNNNNDSFFIVSAFFFKIVLSRARARAYNICASCAHFNHPSHGAALSHVV